MSRIPGTPQNKLQFLSKLDHKTLPYLVADILYFIYKHQEVRVVDGPGDGKRDIFSALPNGSRHITQCKFHQDVQATVSSDETDQLVLALHKFGYKIGLFVTTGKISPQAKREYLDNYPGFELKFIEGVDLVDLVLSNPLLKSIWIHDDSISASVAQLNIPFVLRSASSDKSLIGVGIPKISHESYEIEFDTGWSSVEDFAPYRQPMSKAYFEQNPESFVCYTAKVLGNPTVYRHPEYIRAISAHIASHTSITDLPVTVRFGVPFLESRFPKTRDFDEEKVDKVKLYHIDPVSFVINKQQQSVYEHKWLLLSDQSSWRFVEELNTTQAEWAGWFNRSQNTVFMQQLKWPTNGYEMFPYFQTRRLEQAWLEKSFFITGRTEEFDDLESILSEEELPDVVCPYGPGGHLLAWFHPIVNLIRNYEVQFSGTPLGGDFELILPEGFTDSDYLRLVDKLKAELKSETIAEVNFARAQAISALSDNEILAEYTERETRSAELYHYYHEIPSPVYMHKREFLFVRMWYIPVTPSMAREKIVANPFSQLDRGGRTYFDAKKVAESNKTYLMSTLHYECIPEYSTDEFFDYISTARDEHLKLMEDYIFSLWPEAKLSTFYFWEEELEFRIDYRPGYHALYGKKSIW